MKALKKILLGVFFSFAFLSAQLVGAQAVMQGEVTPGVYKPLRINAYQSMIPVDFYGAIGFGDHSKIRRVVGLGRNTSIDIASVPEDVWAGGGTYPWMTGATSLEFVSTSASDSAAGVGARTVLIVCLDVNYVEVTFNLSSNGLTPVALPSQCFRVNTFVITSAGSTGVNVGDMILRDAGGGTTRSFMPAGYGTAQSSNYTVPAGWTLQIVSQLFALVRSSGGPTRYADIATFMQFPANGNFYRLPVTYSVSDGAPYRHDGLPGIILTEKTDYILRVTSVSTNGLAVSASWLGIMRNNIP